MILTHSFVVKLRLMFSMQSFCFTLPYRCAPLTCRPFRLLGLTGQTRVWTLVCWRKCPLGTELQCEQLCLSNGDFLHLTDTSLPSVTSVEVKNKRKTEELVTVSEEKECFKEAISLASIVSSTEKQGFYFPGVLLFLCLKCNIIFRSDKLQVSLLLI